ncbi:nicotinate phosphoribosyltransferase [Caldovatus sediminis]|uniref:Nicotinate phosphoribosyltransferase n=1 Tax=Caldovatus sediminis TaxID=2041189 RepID=A0A8J3ECC5_9PROT|nr:nicotinate phosphoribosyltransferase [Caldovatus sediminis]GGG45353.1 nicotinate phosphoribosyltransferase [Caldovatus sediminis]
MPLPLPAPLPPGLALFTDLYELRMARAYLALGMERETAVFSLFARRLPRGRNFLLACGIEDLLDTLAALRFAPEDLDHLRALGEFPEEFLRWLAGFRFSGAIHAVPEGTPVFAEEPILEVVAPMAEAQLVETLAMNQVGLQTLLASKAARVVAAAAGRPVVDFGSRRAQGLDAAVAGARAFHLAGVAATSNVLAGARHGIPVAGTMAHSFVQAFDSEAEAFRAYARLYPETILLVDTYDTAEGVRRVVALARELGDAFRVRGVRLDSGDLLALSREARAILDAAGLRQVQVFASGGLDEERIAALLAAGAPIDAFGVGTDMSVSADAPALDLAYKLTAYAGVGRTKLSAGKRILPGRKQVFRRFRDGEAEEDVIARAEEALPGEPLLRPLMRDGRRLHPRPALAQARAETAARVAALPARLRALGPADPPYRVTISTALAAHEREVRARVAAGARGQGGGAPAR